MDVFCDCGTHESCITFSEDGWGEFPVDEAF